MMNRKSATLMIRLSDKAARRIWIQLDLPFPFFRVRFGSYGWWGPWWGWN